MIVGVWIWTASHPTPSPKVEASSGGVAASRDIQGNTITIHGAQGNSRNIKLLAEKGVSAKYGGIATGHDINIGYTPEQVQKLIRASTHDLKTQYQMQVDDLSHKLNTTHAAVVSFFKILNKSKVPSKSSLRLWLRLHSAIKRC